MASTTSTSSTLTPQATDDTYGFTESELLSSTYYDPATQVVTLDVMANDLGGKAKTLYSVDGDMDALTELLQRDTGGVWETARVALWTDGTATPVYRDVGIRIYQGKVQVDLMHALDDLSASQTLQGSFEYAIRLGNGTLSYAKINFSVLGEGASDIVGSDGNDEIAGTGGNDVVLAGAGDDLVSGGDGDDTLDGGDGYDVLLGGAGNDTLISGAGGGVLNGGPGSDTLVGGSGADTFVFDSLPPSAPPVVMAMSAMPMTFSLMATSTQTTPSADGVDVIQGFNAGGDASAPADHISLNGDAFANLARGPGGALGVESFQRYDSTLAGPPSPAGHARILLDVADQSLSYQALDGTITQFAQLVDATGTLDATDFQVTGGNSTPVITSLPQAGSVQEDATLTATGQVTSSDVDSGATATYAGNAQGAYGSFAVNADTGVWTYELANTAQQQLAQGESHIETFTVTVTDDKGAAASQDVTITVTGANDGPVVTSSAQVASVQEDAMITATGRISSLDVDNGATAAYSGSRVGTYGTFTVLADTGEWTYKLANTAQQQLAQGESHNETFTVAVTDDKGATVTQDVTINVTGANDGPVVTSAAQAGSVQEDATLTATGRITSLDVDNGATASYAGNAQGAYGTFTVNAASGVWTYELANTAQQQLAQGESHNETFTVTVTDDKGVTATQDVTITIAGANDGPVILEAMSESATEGGAVISGQLAATDVDQGAKLTYSLDGGAIAGLQLRADGAWTFDPTHADYDHLSGASSTGIQVNYRVTDEHDASSTGTFTITVAGTDDAPTIGGDTAGALTVGEALTTSGKLTISDPDQGESSFAVPDNLSGNYGMFTLSSDGSWGYELHPDNPMVQDLATGDSLEDRITVMSADGSTPTTITVSILGTAVHDTTPMTHIGGDDPDTLSGGYGNDLLDGRGGADHLYGGGGDDTLLGGAGFDRLDGGAGNDLLFGEAGPDMLIDDPTDAWYVGSHLVYANGGNDALYGGEGDDELHSCGGDDQLYGGDGNDSLDSFAGNDQLFGGAGNDRLWAQGGNVVAVTFNGGAGDDTLIGNSQGGNTFVFDTALGFGPDQAGVDKIEQFRLSGIGAPADTVQLSASVFAGLVYGDDGKLDASSFGYHDGSTTASIIVGAPDEAGLTSLSYDADGAGSLFEAVQFATVGNFFDAVHDDNTVNVFGNGYFRVVDERNTQGEVLTGTPGNDLLQGTRGSDVLDGAGGSDFLWDDPAGATTGGNDTLHGGEGDDSLMSFGGDDHLYGDAGNDVLTSDAGNDQLFGGAGDDVLTGNSRGGTTFGFDTALGSAPDQAGVDVITSFWASAPDNSIQADTLFLSATAFNGLYYREDGTLDAGSFGYHEGSTAACIVASDPDASGAISLSYDADGTGSAFEAVQFANLGAVNGTFSNANITGDGERKSSGQVINGGDTLDDVLIGTTGDDTLNGGGGSDVLLDDPLESTLAGNDVLNGGDGDDTLFSLGGDDRLYGDGGNDQLMSFGGNDQLFGGAGDDSLGVQYLNGPAAATPVSLTFNGGAGNDTMVGHVLGGNTFVFDTNLGFAPDQSGIDQVLGFVASAPDAGYTTDALQLSSSVFTGLAYDGVSGRLAASSFVEAGHEPDDSAARIVWSAGQNAYNEPIVNLFYDADGSGSADAILFAQVMSSSGAISNDNIFIIN